LRLNVEFSPPEQERPSGRGVTDNVSAGGVYFLTPDWQDLRPGQSLMLRLSGMTTYNEGPLFRSLGGRATILRINAPESLDSPYARGGVAMRFDERPQVQLYDLSA